MFFLPASMKPSGLWKKRGERVRLNLMNHSSWGDAALRKPEPREHPGRKFGKVEGAWIDDLAARRKALIFCWKCQPKFDHKKANYYKDRRFPHVVGKCDGCRTIMNHETKIYIHESFLGDPDGNSRAGHSWTPM